MITIPTLNRAARVELALLSDAAILELQSMLIHDYKAGYEYAILRSQNRDLSQEEEGVLNIVCAVRSAEYFRSLLKGA